MASSIESFNTANSTTLGPNLTWTEDRGDLQVVGNACRAATLGTFCQARGGTGINPQYASVVVKTFNAPSSGTNFVQVCPYAGAANVIYEGGRISIDSAGVCTVDHIGTNNGAVQFVYAGPVTITAPTVPFTFATRLNVAANTTDVLVNGQVIVTRNAQFGSGTPGMHIYAATNLADVEVDSFYADSVPVGMPASLTGFGWPADGIAYVGPFISSAGNVYLLGNHNNGTNNSLAFWKATDPVFGTFAVTRFGGSTTASVFGSISAHQVGDVLHVTWVSGGFPSYCTLNMSTDTYAGVLQVAIPSPVNQGAAVAKRSTGGDAIVFYNTTGVVSMSKTYGRIAARRSAGGTAAFGAETAIGLPILSATLQSESVDAAVLGTSDRVHLFWTSTQATAGTGDTQQQRTVKSTENLDGTSPSGAAGGIGSGAPGPNNVSPSDVHHTIGQPSCNASGTLFVESASNGTSPVGSFGVTVASADTLGSWTSDTNYTTISPSVSVFGNAFGSTTFDYRAGGALWDGTSRYTTWIDATTLRPYYNGTGTTTWPAPTALPGATGTSTQISSNVFQRGSQVVLAVVFDNATSTWVYNEVVLRTVTPTSAYAQTAFRFVRDDGGEIEASWMAAQNTNVSQLVNGFFNFRLRFEVEETNSIGDTNSFTIQYRKNGGTWAVVATSGTDIRLVTAAGVADGAATTDQLTGSAKSFVAGEFDTNGTVTAVTLSNQSSEFEYSMQAVASGITSGDVFDFRLVVGGTTVLGTYTATPTLTATVPAPLNGTTPVPIFCCGAECGIAVVGTLSAGTEHWSTIGGTPTVVTSGPTPMRSTRCFRFNPTAAASSLRHTYATAISSPAATVARFYIYFTTLPNNNQFLFWESANTASVSFVASDNSLRAGNLGGSFAASGCVVTTGQWYRVDLRITAGTTATSADLMVDGVTYPSWVAGAGATSSSFFNIGPNASTTCDLYIDDIIVSGTSANYPIGEGTVAGLYPNGDKPNSATTPTDGNKGHLYTLATSFGKGSGGATNVGAQNVESTSWQSLTKPLPTAIQTNFVSEKVAGAGTQHLVWSIEDMPADAVTVNGVMAVAATHSATATANTSSLRLIDAAGNAVTVYLLAALSVATITVPVVAMPQAPGSVAWTPTNVNSTFFQWGDSNDIAPVPSLDGVCLEVDYVPVSTARATRKPSDRKAINRGSFY